MRTALTIIVAIVAVLAGSLFYLGVFTPIEWEVVEMGPFTVAGKIYRGPFSGLGPVYQDVEDKMTALIAAPTQMLGVYYDDPSETPEDQLRSFVSGDMVPEDISKFEGHPDLVTKQYPKTKCLIAKFPMRSLMISPMLGAMLVYPTMEAGMKQSGLDFKEAKSVFELCAGNWIYYAIPIEHQAVWNEVPGETPKEKDTKEE